MVLPSFGPSINIRSAKAHLSALLEMVAGGKELVITSDGKPKARLVPVDSAPKRKPFRVDRELLASMPMQTAGPFSTELIRAERDERW